MTMKAAQITTAMGISERRDRREALGIGTPIGGRSRPKGSPKPREATWAAGVLDRVAKGHNVEDSEREEALRIQGRNTAALARATAQAALTSRLRAGVEKIFESGALDPRGEDLVEGASAALDQMSRGRYDVAAMVKVGEEFRHHLRQDSFLEFWRDSPSTLRNAKGARRNQREGRGAYRA